MRSVYGCFCKFGVLLVSVLIGKGLLFGCLGSILGPLILRNSHDMSRYPHGTHVDSHYDMLLKHLKTNVSIVKLHGTFVPPMSLRPAEIIAGVILRYT